MVAARAEERARWVATTIERYGATIMQFDPAAQQRMKPRPEPWRRHTNNDPDVTWVIDVFPDGIHRHDLPPLARTDDLAQLRRAFVATMLWGAGDTNRYYGRHAAAFSYPTLVPKLSRADRLIDVGDPMAAWSSMREVPGIRYPFFTKWLWVLGEARGIQPTPLVFDSRVTAALKARGWPWAKGQINDRARWRDFCTDAASVAEGGGDAVTSEWVEYWLFSGAPEQPPSVNIDSEGC